MIWFKAFLTDRKVCVRINDTRSLFHVTIVRLTDVRPRRVAVKMYVLLLFVLSPVSRYEAVVMQAVYLRSL